MQLPISQTQFIIHSLLCIIATTLLAFTFSQPLANSTSIFNQQNPQEPKKSIVTPVTEQIW